MDELTVMRSFRAERVKQNPMARAAALEALEACFDSVPGSASAAPALARRRGFFRRRLLVFAVAAAAAAAVAGILVLSSGPTAQPAAAEILHETAAIAAATDAPAAIPGPGQFLFMKFQRLELESWVPGGAGMMGGVMTRPGAFKALMPTTQEWWTAPDGAGRVRQVAGKRRGHGCPPPSTPNTSESIPSPSVTRSRCAEEWSTPNTQS
jgi:hypothetical protein